jgi:hypothetical protein
LVFADRPPTTQAVDAVVHVNPPGLEVTTYCVGEGPELGAVHDTRTPREELGLETGEAEAPVGEFGFTPIRTLMEDVPEKNPFEGFHTSIHSPSSGPQ